MAEDEREDPKASEWRKQNNLFHEALVEERGEGWQAFWGSHASQMVRYDVFLQHLPLESAAVLDIGCGFGDFAGYMQEKGVKVGRYLGIDLDPVILEKAKARRPDMAFAVMDILSEDPPFTPDYIVASGIMAVKFASHAEYMLRILRRFHALCRAGFALNFLSSCSLKPDQKSQYVDPWRVMEQFQREIDWRCLLVHDYRPNDFTLVHRRS